MLRIKKVGEIRIFTRLRVDGTIFNTTYNCTRLLSWYSLPNKKLLAAAEDKRRKYLILNVDLMAL